MRISTYRYICIVSTDSPTEPERDDAENGGLFPQRHRCGVTFFAAMDGHRSPASFACFATSCSTASVLRLPTLEFASHCTCAPAPRTMLSSKGRQLGDKDAGLGKNKEQRAVSATDPRGRGVRFTWRCLESRRAPRSPRVGETRSFASGRAAVARREFAGNAAHGRAYSSTLSRRTNGAPPVACSSSAV